MQQFSFERLDLEGAFLINPFVQEDSRGCFVKDYSLDAFRAAGLSHSIGEVFYSTSHKGVIRGLHFQTGHQQQKLVRCVSGSIFDVIVDLRPESSTYKQWRGFELSGENHRELLVPKQFAHGFLALEDSTVVYKCDEQFDPKGDGGIRWDDQEIAVKWPLDQVGGLDSITLSQKDRDLPLFRSYSNALVLMK